MNMISRALRPGKAASSAKADPEAHPTAGHALDAARDPLRAVGILALVHLLAWTLLPSLVSSSPPLDVVEGLLWGQEWQLGYHKHPPLPPILVNIARDLTASPIWGPYLLSQVCVGLTFLFVFLTGRLVTRAQNALVATALLVGVYYFTWPTPEFNHNVAQLPVWSGAIWLFATIRTSPQRRVTWLWLGLVCGIGIYTKYSVLVLYVSFVGWMLVEPRMRAHLATVWPWLGGVLSVLVAAPHLAWLVASDFAPIRYASERGSEPGSTVGPAGFLLAQLVNHAPLLVVVGAIGPLWIRRLPQAGHARSDLAFVAAMLFGPLAVTVIAAGVVGIALRDMWGMPMFSLSGLAIVMMLDRDWDRRMANRAFYVAVTTTLVVAIGYVVSVRVREDRGDRSRVSWPMARMATLADRAWQQATHRPLAIVSGPMWIAGLISAGSPSRPHVVYDGDLAISPWVTPAMMKRDGTLYVWQDDKAPAVVSDRGATITTRGSFLIHDKVGTISINYAIEPPAP